METPRLKRFKDKKFKGVEKKQNEIQFEKYFLQSYFCVKSCKCHNLFENVQSLNNPSTSFPASSTLFDSI